MTRLLLQTLPDGRAGLETMLSASPEDGAALAPGPAAVLPLNPQLLQMVGLLTCLCSFCNRRCQELDLMIRHHAFLWWLASGIVFGDLSRSKREASQHTTRWHSHEMSRMRLLQPPDQLPARVQTSS